MRCIFISMMVVFLLLAGCVASAIKVDKDDIIGNILASKGLTRQTARPDAATLDIIASSQVMMQSHFMRYWKNPWIFPGFVYSITDWQAEKCEGPEGIYRMFVMSTVRTGHKITGYIQYAPAFKSETDNPLVEALEMMYERCNKTLSKRVKSGIKKKMKDVPPEVQLAMAKFIYAAGEAKYYRDRALRNYPKEKWQEAFDFACQAFKADTKDAHSGFENGSVINWDLGQKLDYDDLFTGAVPNLLAIMDLESFLKNPVAAKEESDKEAKKEGEKEAAPKKIDLSDIKFEFDTPLGKLVFNGREENNTYKGNDYFLIIDLAGNDIYRGATASSWQLEHPISTVIDWAGDDKYIADEDTPCTQGAGVLGYGFLIDQAGNDTFKAFDNAQGMSYFGVGLLWATGGDDVFEARYLAQGSASFGVANLIKKGGDDKYYACYVSQGFGFVGGYGCLLDTGGNDRYIAEPYKLFKAATGGHDNLRNYSFCQGAGWGQRGDIAGGHSMAGGFGMLQDLGGDDWYECGVYGQATGYWYGTGVLHDKSGNDHYEGSFFVQSGTAHMGLTMLLDETGDDSYHVWHAISQAGAHDVSVSWLIDKAGDDKVSVWEWKDEKGKQSLEPTDKKGGGGTCVGSAINNSVGIFLNIGGDDTYEIYTGQSFGWSLHGTENWGSWRYNVFNIAMFIDVGGKDIYKVPANAKWAKNIRNNSKWVRIDKKGNQDKSFSMGIDTETGIVREANKGY